MQKKAKNDLAELNFCKKLGRISSTPHRSERFSRSTDPLLLKIQPCFPDLLGLIYNI